jgi:hypothetical protein
LSRLSAIISKHDAMKTMKINAESFQPLCSILISVQASGIVNKHDRANFLALLLGPRALECVVTVISLIDFEPPHGF